MACGSCKEKVYRIYLKFDAEQRVDPVFKRKVFEFLTAQMLRYSPDQIKQIVEFATTCERSLIAEDSSDKIIELSKKCAFHKIPIEVNHSGVYK